MIDREALAELPARLRDAATYGYMPARVRALLNEAAEALTHAGEGAVPVGKVKPLDLSNLMRDAFMAGRGHKGQLSRLSEEDQQAWVEYDPEPLPCFHRILAAIASSHTPRQDGAREGQSQELIDAAYKAACAAMPPEVLNEIAPGELERVVKAVLATTPPAPDEAVEAEKTYDWPSDIRSMIKQAEYNLTSLQMSYREKEAYKQALRHIEISISNAVSYRARSRRDVGGGV